MIATPLRPTLGAAKLPAQQPGESAAKYIALILGVGMLTSFNFLLNMIPWLTALYSRPDWGFITSLALVYPGVAVQFVMLPVGRFVPASLRIRGPIAINLCILAALPTLAPLGVTLGIVLLLLSGISTAVMESRYVWTQGE